MGVTAETVPRLWCTGLVSALSFGGGCHMLGGTHTAPTQQHSRGTLPDRGFRPSCWTCTTAADTCGPADRWESSLYKGPTWDKRVSLPRLVAEGLTPPRTQFALLHWNAVVCWYYDSAQGNGDHWNWSPEWLHVCSNAGTFVIVVFKMNRSPDLLCSFPNGR